MKGEERRGERSGVGYVSDGMGWDGMSEVLYICMYFS